MKSKVLFSGVLWVAIFVAAFVFSSPKNLLAQVHDVTPPEVTSVTPPDGASNVSVSLERVRIEFSEPMDRSTYSRHIYVADPAGTWIGGCAYSGESVYEVVFCGEVLQPNTVYDVHVTTDVTDLAGNHLAEEFVSSFTTKILLIEVEIDIKPGTDTNSINLKSKGVVPVAVLTTDDFDASTIDPDTCLFAGADPERWTMEDVDGDGDLDMLFHCRTQELCLIEDSEEATVTGFCEDGTPIEGADSVVIVLKPKNGPLHPMKYEIVVTYYTDGEEGDWIGIELTDEEDNPVSGDYVLYLPNGDTRTGATDENGFAKEEDVEPGTATVEFPNLKFKKHISISPL